MNFYELLQEIDAARWPDWTPEINRKQKANLSKLIPKDPFAKNDISGDLDQSLPQSSQSPPQSSQSHLQSYWEEAMTSLQELNNLLDYDEKNFSEIKISLDKFYFNLNQWMKLAKDQD